MPEPQPAISVVIPTHNRRDSLLRLLRALRDGTFPVNQIEVVVVADGCTDDTPTAVPAEPLPFPVRVLEQRPSRGAAAARNLGAQHATGVLLVFIDDDIEPVPAFLAEHQHSHLELGTPALVIGPPYPVRPAAPDFSAIAVWAWWHEQFAAMEQPGHRFSFEEIFGANLSLPAALFAEVGGFDATLRCREDPELGFRILRTGARIAFNPRALGWHHELRNRPAIIQRKLDEGKADVELVRKHPELWPALWLSRDEPTERLVRRLHRLALDRPRLGDLYARWLERRLGLLEGIRARHSWRRLNGALHYYWYWRGASAAVGGRAGLAALKAECLAQLNWETPTVLDLGLGVEAAERLLDAQRPMAARLCWNQLPVGEIRQRSGAERLRGAHLRQAIRTELSQPLLATLTIAAAMGDPRASPAGIRRRRVSSDSRAVSVVIPAYNAGHTIAETLDSLRAQTFPQWEGIVVDDGSTDDTIAVVRRYAARDSRIRLVRRFHGGASAARVQGVHVAQFDWILFLDADDWIRPQHLERMTQALTEDRSLDAVHCGWAIMGPEGQELESAYCKPTGDLFPVLARHPAFVIHACVMRRSLIEAVGGFDPAFARIQDWVLWQRIARVGCRFGAVRETLALYRMRADSLSADPRGVLEESLRAIELGHSPDPGVPSPLPIHAAGRPRHQLPDARLEFLAWPAGMMLARGEDARVLLSQVDSAECPGLLLYAAETIHAALPRAIGRPRAAWLELWPSLEERVRQFLAALETHARTPGLARGAELRLARLVLEAAAPSEPVTIGRLHAVPVEITEPLGDVAPPAGAERVWATIFVEGKRLGVVELPVCDGLVPASVLADAIADQFAWDILGLFFERTIYRYRSDGSDSGHTNLHDFVGWDTLLQEVWSHDAEIASAMRDRGGEWITIEVAQPIPDLASHADGATIALRVGGALLGVFQLGQSDLFTQQAIRHALADTAGYELCRVAVREALVGQPLDGRTLGERLRSAAVRRELVDGALPANGIESSPAATPAQAGGVLTVGRYIHLPVGSSASRRAALPSAAASLLREAAASTGQVITGPSSGDEMRVMYDPELITEPTRAVPDSPGGSPEVHTTGGYDRHYFETVFAQATDPWRYDSEYETAKYEQALGMVPIDGVGQALEIACAEGHFTERLAPMTRRLIAADISNLALERAAKRCESFRHVEFRQLDLTRDPIPSDNELIVCSEVLYYMGGAAGLSRVTTALAAALTPGGHLLTAHANVLNDEPTEPGFDWDFPFGAVGIAKALAAVPSLRLVRELRTPLYRIQLHRRATVDDPQTTPLLEQIAEVAPLQPAAAARIRWNGGGVTPSRSPERPVETERLPILTYHRIAESGAAENARWRVTPAMFEKHLGYLRDAGFRSVELDEWRAAMARRRPLPGRAVAITFDDGYDDFITTAWPLLKRYGFSATLFVVPNRVGLSVDWVRYSGEREALMSWDQLRTLRDEGVTLGAHSCTHPYLTTLSCEEIVREAAGARIIIERELNVRISAFAYPFGDEDPAVQHLVGACGYEYGLSYRGPSRLTDALLELPRIEIDGSDDLTTFVVKLGQ